MKYNLCISIPIKFATTKEVRPIIDKAIKLKPNIIELRFDYISNLESLSLDFVRDLLNIIHPHAAVIFTLRSSSEGGQLKMNLREYFKVMKMLIEVKPDYLDLEMSTHKTVLKDIIKLASQNEIKLICSYHNFEKTMNFDESIILIKDFNQKLTQELSLDSKILEDIIYKLIFTAQNFEDNLIPLKLCKELSKSKQKIISFCMGTLGIFSRITCVIAGSFLTYASLKEKTAPGQIHIKKIRKTYKLLFEDF